MNIIRSLLLTILVLAGIPAHGIDAAQQDTSSSHYALARALAIKKAAMLTLQAKSNSAAPGQFETRENYNWAVVGGGIAGILSIGFLIENGVHPSSIAWIDEKFNVGALGKDYQTVPGNLSTQQWINTLEKCDYLKQCPYDPIEYLKQFDLDSFYSLNIIVNPMQQITHWLLNQVYGFRKKVVQVDSHNNDWYLTLSDGSLLRAHKVILATGSRPRSLDYPCDQEISLPIALDKSQLAQQVKPDDTIAVVGSAHSAVVAMMHLSELPVKKIVHFYTHPFVYTQKIERGIVNAESGLKGPAAAFAKDMIEEDKVPNLVRVFNDKQGRDSWLPQCTKIIYAVGFTPNTIPWFSGDPLHYDDTTGIIARNLFGFGIAFPEKKTDAYGKVERRVGMPYFVEYGKHIVPQWVLMV